jgi:hypothetical protein
MSQSYNFGHSIISVVATSLGFILSMSLNEAFKLSFQFLINNNKNNEHKDELQSAWIYAIFSTIFIITLLYVLLGCIKPTIKTNLPCKSPWSWLIPLISAVILIGIVLLSYFFK